MAQPLLGLILAGGRGTRFGELSKRLPKPLLPVAGKPLIVWNIEGLRDAGVQDITIVISPDSERVRTDLGDGHSLGVNLDYLVQHEHLGTAHAIGLAKDVMGDSRFVVCWSDNLTSYNMNDLVENDRAFPADGTVAVHFTDEPRKGGIVVTRGRKAVEFEEKPENPRSNLNLAGMYIIGPWVFPCIERTRKSAKHGEWFLPDAFQIAVNDGLVLNWALVADWRMNVNTPADLLVGNARLLEHDGRTVPSDGSFTVSPPVFIGDGVNIGSGAVVGPYVSISAGAEIGTNARIEDAVVLTGASVPAGAEIGRAIVDSDGTVYPAE